MAMAGHSKWANIKRKKEVNDKAKGYIFAKLSRLITLAVQQSGGIIQPEANMKLRMAIEKAKSNDMPKDNIQRAIEKGARGSHEGLQEVVYELFAPEGVMMIVVCATDNPTRTVHELRSRIESRGGSIGNQGSVLYLFNKCGLVRFHKDLITDDVLLNIAESLTATDILDEGGGDICLYIPFDQFGKIGEALKGLGTYQAEIVYKPINGLELHSENQARQTQDVIETIEEVEDVQSVFTNVFGL